MSNKAEFVELLTCAGAKMNYYVPFGLTCFSNVLASGNDELFKEFLNHINNNPKKLFEALKIARELGKTEYSSRIQRIIDGNTKFDSLILFIRNGFQHSRQHVLELTIKILAQYKDLGGVYIVKALLEIFKNKYYNLLLDLILRKTPGIGAVTSDLKLELWREFFDFVVNSPRKEELFTYLKNNPQVSSSFTYYAYLILIGIMDDEEFKRWVLKNLSFAFRTLEVLIRSFYFNVNANLLARVKTAFDWIQSKIDSLQLCDQSVVVFTFWKRIVDFYADVSNLPDALRHEKLSIKDKIIFIKHTLKSEGGEEIVKNAINEMDADSLMQIVKVGAQNYLPVSEESLTLLFKFFQLIPKDSPFEYYHKNFISNISICNFNVSECYISHGSESNKYRYRMVFKTKPNHVTMGLPETIDNQSNEADGEYLCNLLTSLTFENREVFINSFRTVMNLVGLEKFKETIQKATFRSEVIQTLIESDELIELFQRENIRISFNTEQVDRISIENVSAKFKEKSVLLIGGKAKKIPSNDPNYWTKLEILTGIKIDQLLTSCVVPTLEDFPEVYLNARNGFVHWMNTCRETMSNIQSVKLKNILLTDLPELKSILAQGNSNELEQDFKRRRIDVQDI